MAANAMKVIEITRYMAATEYYRSAFDVVSTALRRHYMTI
jgi:hypothetical protein